LTLDVTHGRKPVSSLTKTSAGTPVSFGRARPTGRTVPPPRERPGLCAGTAVCPPVRGRDQQPIPFLFPGTASRVSNPSSLADLGANQFLRRKRNQFQQQRVETSRFHHHRRGALHADAKSADRRPAPWPRRRKPCHSADVQQTYPQAGQSPILENRTVRPHESRIPVCAGSGNTLPASAVGCTIIEGGFAPAWDPTSVIPRAGDSRIRFVPLAFRTAAGPSTPPSSLPDFRSERSKARRVSLVVLEHGFRNSRNAGISNVDPPH